MPWNASNNSTPVILPNELWRRWRYGPGRGGIRDSPCGAASLIISLRRDDVSCLVGKSVDDFPGFSAAKGWGRRAPLSPLPPRPWTGPPWADRCRDRR